MVIKGKKIERIVIIVNSLNALFDFAKQYPNPSAYKFFKDELAEIVTDPDDFEIALKKLVKILGI